MTPRSFATALEALPPSSLHAKVLELSNSIKHLLSSNQQLAQYPDDPDCKEAIAENVEVLERMRVRLSLCREEVERRGLMWVDLGGEDGQDSFRSDKEEELRILMLAELELENEGWERSAASTSTSTSATARPDTTVGPSQIPNHDEGVLPEAVAQGNGVTSAAQESSATSGSLTDDELRRQLEARILANMPSDTTPDDGNASNDSEEGLYL